MNKRGKSINVFLMDGDVSGRVKSTLANWTGLAYKIPRTELDRCEEREDLSQSGVYFLFGISDETGNPVVYIGQAGIRKNGEGLLNRLYEHRRDPQKGYWTEAIVLTTSNNSLGPTEISYLENRFCKLAGQAKRYEVKNGNDPSPGNPTEEKVCEMEEFIDYAKVIVGVLGHKVFEPLSGISVGDGESENPDADLLYLERTIGKTCHVRGIGRQSADGFVVLGGSVIATEEDEATPSTVKAARARAKRDEKGLLEEDVLLSSPSYAACFVVGKKAVNGPASWKNAQGVSLKQLECEKQEPLPPC